MTDYKNEIEKIFKREPSLTPAAVLKLLMDNYSHWLYTITGYHNFSFTAMKISLLIESRCNSDDHNYLWNEIALILVQIPIIEIDKNGNFAKLLQAFFGRYSFLIQFLQNNSNRLTKHLEINPYYTITDVQNILQHADIMSKKTILNIIYSMDIESRSLLFKSLINKLRESKDKEESEVNSFILNILSDVVSVITESDSLLIIDIIEKRIAKDITIYSKFIHSFTLSNFYMHLKDWSKIAIVLEMLAKLVDKDFLNLPISKIQLIESIDKLTNNMSFKFQKIVFDRISYYVNTNLPLDIYLGSLYILNRISVANNNVFFEKIMTMIFPIWRFRNSGMDAVKYFPAMLKLFVNYPDEIKIDICMRFIESHLDEPALLDHEELEFLKRFFSFIDDKKTLISMLLNLMNSKNSSSIENVLKIFIPEMSNADIHSGLATLASTTWDHKVYFILSFAFREIKLTENFKIKLFNKLQSKISNLDGNSQYLIFSLFPEILKKANDEISKLVLNTSFLMASTFDSRFVDNIKSLNPDIFNQRGDLIRFELYTFYSKCLTNHSPNLDKLLLILKISLFSEFLTSKEKYELSRELILIASDISIYIDPRRSNTSYQCSFTYSDLIKANIRLTQSATYNTTYQLISGIELLLKREKPLRVFALISIPDFFNSIELHFQERICTLLASYLKPHVDVDKNQEMRDALLQIMTKLDKGSDLYLKIKYLITEGYLQEISGDIIFSEFTIISLSRFFKDGIFDYKVMEKFIDLRNHPSADIRNISNKSLNLLARSTKSSQIIRRIINYNIQNLVEPYISTTALCNLSTLSQIIPEDLKDNLIANIHPMFLQESTYDLNSRINGIIKLFGYKFKPLILHSTLFYQKDENSAYKVLKFLYRRIPKVIEDMFIENYNLIIKSFNSNDTTIKAEEIKNASIIINVFSLIIKFDPDKNKDLAQPIPIEFKPNAIKFIMTNISGKLPQINFWKDILLYYYKSWDNSGKKMIVDIFFSSLLDKSLSMKNIEPQFIFELANAICDTANVDELQNMQNHVAKVFLKHQTKDTSSIIHKDLQKIFLYLASRFRVDNLVRPATNTVLNNNDVTNITLQYAFR
jgi:hypothetical protein